MAFKLNLDQEFYHINWLLRPHGTPGKMKFFSVTTFVALAFAVVDAAFRAGEFVRIEGLEGNRANGSYACVLKSAEETGNDRVQVIAVNEDGVMEFDPESPRDFSTADYFFNILVKPENLTRFEWNMPQQRPMEEIIADMVSGRGGSNWVSVPVPPQTQALLNRVSVLLWKICKGNPGNILDRESIEIRFRVIGAWILQNYGHHAMVYACERDRAMYRYIETVWHGIGAWMA